MPDLESRALDHMFAQRARILVRVPLPVRPTVEAHPVTDLAAREHDDPLSFPPVEDRLPGIDLLFRADRDVDIAGMVGHMDHPPETGKPEFVVLRIDAKRVANMRTETHLPLLLPAVVGHLDP